MSKKKTGTQPTRIKTKVAERMLKFIEDVGYGSQSLLVSNAVESWLDRNEQAYRDLVAEMAKK